MTDYSHDEVLDMLWSIPPDSLNDYNDELRVTAAALSAGATDDDVLSWWQQSPNFDERESLKHIRSLKPEGGATAGTLVYFARQNGWSRDTTAAAHRRPQVPTASAKAETTTPRPPSAPKIDPQHIEVTELRDLTPAEELERYLSALFKPDEIYNVVTNASHNEVQDKWNPNDKGAWRTVGPVVGYLLDERRDNNDPAIYDETLQVVLLGKPNPEAGVWIRVNPLSAGGATDKDVTDHRFTLLESDTMTKTEQVQFYHDHHIPCAAIVDSGGKSVHAIVRIDARDRDEYDNRVRLLYDYCEANGFELDPNDKNPSRLTRLPGVQRGEERQRLLYLNTGARNFEEWRQWVENEQDAERNEYPAIIPMRDMVGDNLKPHAPEVIDGILRRGWLMLLTAASKKGKTHLVTQLMVALAGGTEWLGHHCEVSNSLYVNLEVDPIELGYRLDEPRKLMHLSDEALDRVATWSPLDNPISLDEILEYIEAHTTPGQYDVVIIDPIYMLLEGDENNAHDMTAFLRKLKCFGRRHRCAVIITHHHSKGPKGGAAAIDRGAGSGVFGRICEALVDLTELDVLESDTEAITYLEDMRAEHNPPARPFRVSYETRDFADVEQQNVVFCSPLFYVDTEGHLDGIPLVGSLDSKRRQGGQTRSRQFETQREQKTAAILEAMRACDEAGVITSIVNIHRRIADPWKAHGLGKAPTEKTLRNYCTPKNSMPFEQDDCGLVVYIDEANETQDEE